MENKNDLAKIKEAITLTLNDEQIDTAGMYLFGSRARGDFSKKSDYDILLVTRKKIGIKEKIKLFTRLMRVLAKQRYNVDIVIKSEEETTYYKSKIGHIVRSALNEGILI
ncbi:MAG: nucleotidyltransferase domain-containing protein [Acidobacteria bacterium]|jgi:predicted nucleotidyltransferase|nr:nucleotidyltransferase domain-containing protein [Acidobacteriota bacterium]